MAMRPEPDPIHDPRLTRLLGVRASAPVPAGLSDRVFRASLQVLPQSPGTREVVGRISFRWLAAAAALLLVAGLAMRWSAANEPEEPAGTSLAVVLEASDDSNLGDELPSLKAMHGARFADLDDEMNRVLGSGRMGR